MVSKSAIKNSNECSGLCHLQHEVYNTCSNARLRVTPSSWCLVEHRKHARSSRRQALIGHWRSHHLSQGTHQALPSELQTSPNYSANGCRSLCNWKLQRYLGRLHAARSSGSLHGARCPRAHQSSCHHRDFRCSRKMGICTQQVDQPRMVSPKTSACIKPAQPAQGVRKRFRVSNE